MGYDPAIIPGWDSPTSPNFGILEVVPWRLRVMPGTVMIRGEGSVLTWVSPQARNGPLSPTSRKYAAAVDGSRLV